jgi:hypothetical protein
MTETIETRKLLVAAFEDLMTSRGYTRRRKSDPFGKRGDGWELTVDLRPSITYGRVSADLVFRGTVEAFEARLVSLIGPDLHGRLGTITFREDAGSLIPENTLLELNNGADDIPPLIKLVERAVLDMERFAGKASDPGELCDTDRVILVRQGLACWESGHRTNARSRLEEASSAGPPHVREAAGLLLTRLADG